MGALDARLPAANPGEPSPVCDVMLSLGDSISAGIGAGHVSEGCMALLAAHLRRDHPALDHLNLSVPGESSTTMLHPGGQLDRAEAAIARTLEGGAAVGPLTVSIGGNDALEAALVGEEDARRRLAANLETILGRLEAALSPRPLAGIACLMTFYNPFERGENAPDHESPGADLLAPRRARGGGFNRVIREAAWRRGLRLVDIAGSFRGRALELTWVGSGDIHPNSHGHEEIARAHLAALGVTR